MAPYLERIPRDVLQHIAFMGASSSPLESIHHILHLLLTSSTIYRSLSIHSCPQLYASIFRVKFDVPSIQNNFDKSTDSALATELVQRCRMLNRASNHDFMVKGLRQDLWTALWMVLESSAGGLNEVQLAASGFSGFIILLLRRALEKPAPAGRGGRAGLLDEISTLATLLLSLTLSQRDIMNTSADIRGELLNLLRPFTSLISRAPVGSIQSFGAHTSQPATRRNQQDTANVILCGPPSYSVIIYAKRRFLTCPPPLSAAIDLTFALMDTTPVDIPTHLPATRAEAIVAQRPGPTIEDFSVLAGLRTPLYADPVSKGSGEDHRSVVHDSEFSGLLNEISSIHGPQKYTYIPGTLAGIWEGSYMVSGDLHHKDDGSQGPPDFICRKPMQCVLSEHIRLRPHPSTPREVKSKVSPSTNLDFIPENKVPPADGVMGEEHPFLRNADVLDITLTGETLERHEQAWGAFRFSGWVQQDGTIILKREPKYIGEDGLGTWSFEGRLRFDSVFVGQWRSSVEADSGGIRGIFRLCKVVDW